MTGFLWSQRQDIGPSPRGGHAMAYDEARERVVLFGGASGGALLADTWEWDGEFWTQVQNAGPSARSMPGLAYDGTHTVLFGGEPAPVGGEPVMSGETWGWDGSDWTQLDDSGPASRAYAPLERDPVRGGLLLFGGKTATSMLRDTWRYADGQWTQVEDSGPSPRAGHSLAWDAARRVVVLFGGAGFGPALADTWEWDGARWTQVQDVGPAPTAHAAVAGAGDGVVLFGGKDTFWATASGVSAETWQWAASHWTRRQDIGPSARWGSAAALDAKRSRIVLFGGYTSVGGVLAPAGDTWEAPVAPASGEGIIPATEGITFVSQPPLTTGSPFGILLYSVAQPPAQDLTLLVKVDGVVDPLTSPILRAGAAQGFVVFSTQNRPAGSLAVTLEAPGYGGGTSVARVEGARLGRLTVAPIPVSTNLSFTLVVEEPSLETRSAMAVALKPGLLPGLGKPFTIPGAFVGQYGVNQPLMPDVPRGDYTLVAFSDFGAARHVSDIVTVKVA